AMCAAFSSWLTPASAYVWATLHESGRGYFNGAVMVNMLCRQPEAAAERLAGLTWDSHRTGRHANAQPRQPVGKLVCIARGHDQYALTDAHHTSAVHETLLPVPACG